MTPLEARLLFWGGLFIIGIILLAIFYAYEDHKVNKMREQAKNDPRYADPSEGTDAWGNW